jgi:pimeloyl-ACP methyl ester carboxylesterase
MIDVGGHQLALYCSGDGSPTVLLEAGLGGDHTSWALVQPDIAREYRVCSYDRAGLGRSDPGPLPRTSQQISSELHTLLTTAEIAPPYILVGHSFGALHIRTYADQHPDTVLGMVFVDAVHEDWWERAAETLPPPGETDDERLTSLRAYLTAGYRDPANNGEGIDIPASVQQVRQTGTFGATPIIVLTGGIFNVLAPGLTPDVEAKLQTLFQDELQGRLAALSTNSARIVAPNSGHNMPEDNPQAIITAVQALQSAMAN